MTVDAAGWWSQHGVHAALTAGPILAFALLGLGADMRARWRRAGREFRWSPLAMAAVLSAAAALVHVAVCPEHFREAAIYGAFFTVTASAQSGWAALVLLRPRRWLAPAGLLGNASLVLLWAVTRTIGVPLGPGSGEVERIGVLDVVATACEISVVALCAITVMQTVQPWRKPRRSGYATRCSTG